MRDDKVKEYTTALEQAAKELRSKTTGNEKLIDKLHEAIGYITERAKIDKHQFERELKEIKETYSTTKKERL